MLDTDTLNAKILSLPPDKRRAFLKLIKGQGVNISKLPIFPREQAGFHLPLSFAQERIWFFEQFSPGSSVYNMPLGLRLKGGLNQAALAASLNEMVRRHEALRTRYELKDGQPIQVIEPTLPLPLPVIDLKSEPAETREETALRLCNEEAQRPFDLARGPVLRAKLFRLEEGEHILLVVMHHVASDGWSMALLVRELNALYAAYHSGQPSPLAPLPIQYADYTLWQREWLQGEELTRQLEYWKKQLAGAPMLLELPTDHPRPAVTQSFRGAVQVCEWPRELLAGLKQLSRKADASLFMTLLAGFQVLLQRYTRQDEMIVGSPIAGRDRAELEDLIGFFVNTLAFRGNLTGNPTFLTLLKQTREVALGAFEHQSLPFEKLVEALHPERHGNHSPIFQVMLVLQNTPEETIQLSGMEISPEKIARGVSAFDLTVMVHERDKDLRVAMEYNSDLYEAKTIRRMMKHYQTLLESAVNYPEQPISQLKLLTPEELNFFTDMNQNNADFVRGKGIHELFEAWAERTPRAVALYFGGERMSYGELEQSANRLARHLQKLGVGPESLVGLSVERSLEMIIGILGILKAGGAYVPMDPEYPRERLSYMLADARPKVLVTQKKFAANFISNDIQVVQLDGDWGEISRQPGERVASGVNDRNLAYMIYTSGSTGRPKGVLLEHRGLCNLTQAQIEYFEIKPESRVLQFASLSFDASVSEIFCALAAGASLVLGRREELLPGAEFVELLRAQAVSVATLPPTVLHAMSEEGLPTLKTVVSAGEACTLELAQRWGRGRRFINAYGPTETTVCATMEMIGPEETKVTIGRPIGNTQIYILDKDLQKVPVGVPGELHVGGISLARGYHNRPELTGEKFIANPFGVEGGERLYKTGDLGRYLPDGRIEYLGRVDQQVKIRGFRIELGEIEAQLGACPGVREAVVVAREAAEGGKYLAGYVVLKEAQRVEVADLRKALAANLPEYMIPSALVILEKFPLTPNGKIDRKALPEADLTVAMLGKGDYVPPTSATEKLIAEIWAEVLGIQQISVTHTFFELGGHSLLMVKLQTKLSETLKKNILITELFQFPTISLFARHLDDGNSIQNNMNSMVNAKDRANRQKQALAQQMKKIKK